MRREIDWASLPLGKISDHKIARQIGVSPSTVWLQRMKRGIGPARPRDDISHVSSEFGAASDGEIARKHGICRARVWRLRNKLNLKTQHARIMEQMKLMVEDGRTIESIVESTGGKRRTAVVARNDFARGRIDWDKQPLGNMSDPKLATMLGVSEHIVKQERRLRGIPAYTRWDEVDWSNIDPLFGKVSCSEIAKRFGLTSTRVRARRIAILGVSPDDTMSKRALGYVGLWPDEVIQKWLGCSYRPVKDARRVEPRTKPVKWSKAKTTAYLEAIDLMRGAS